MSKQKIRYFEVKEPINKALTWSLVAYLLFQALIEAGDYIGLARVSNGPIVYGISRITQSGVGRVLLTLASTASLVFIWEWFRRGLNKSKSVISYVVLALITLMICDVPFSFVPEGGFITQIHQPSRFENFAQNFIFASSGVQSILQIVLSIALLVKFRGRISAFGWANLASIFMIAYGTGWLYTKSADYMTQTLAAGFTFFRYVIGVFPIVFLRRTMKYTTIHDADSSNDLGSEHI